MSRLVLVISVVCASFVTSYLEALPRLKSHHDVRITGGTEATKGQFPFIVALNDATNYPYCSGVIFNKKWVLTAAQCVAVTYPTDVVVAGRYTTNETRVTFHINQSIVHEDFSFWTFVNDIAVVELEGEFVYDDNIQPIEFTDLSDNTVCTIIGWGKIEDHSFPNVLHYAEEPIIDLETCKNITLDDGSYLGEGKICGMSTEGVGICDSDQGALWSVMENWLF